MSVSFGKMMTGEIRSTRRTSCSITTFF